MINSEDMKQIKAEMYDVFVTKESCSNRRDEVKDSISKIEQKMAISDTKLNAIIWVSALAATATIGEFLARIMHLI